MSVLINNELGSIKLTSSVAAKILCKCIEENFKDKVWLTDLNGINILECSDLPPVVDFYMGERGIVLTVPVIVRFGTSISKLSDQLYESLKIEFQEILNLKMEKMVLKVRGVRSKQIAARHVDVIRPAENATSI